MSKKSDDRKTTGDWEKELERRVEILEQRATVGDESGELKKLKHRIEQIEQWICGSDDTEELKKLERRIELLEQRASSGAIAGKRKWRGTSLTAPNMRS